jgi:histone H2B
MSTKKAAIKKLDESSVSASQKTEISEKTQSSQKKPKKSVPSSQTNESQRKKIRHKKRSETFSTYIFKILKQVHPNVGISKGGMKVMNSFVVDIFERIAKEGGTLVSMNEKQILGTREIQTSVRLVLPGELSKHAITEGGKAISKFLTKTEN